MSNETGGVKSPNYIPLYAVKPKRDALGRPIKNRFVRFWGGRKPSKYDPATEDAKHAKQGKAAA